MKILIINGSPRKKGNSIYLSEKVAESVKANGAEVTTLNLCDMSIKPCIACDGCTKNKVNCVINDDMQGIYQHINEADGIIFATPVYWFSMSSFMKILWDRLYGLYGNKPKFLQGKKSSIIITHAESEAMTSGASNVYRSLADSIVFCGGEVCNVMNVSCYELGEVKNNAKAIEEAEELGKNIVKDLI